jgi:hypothetical protein
VDRHIISWTIENWITVMLMAALGYFLILILVKLFGLSGTPSFAGLFGGTGTTSSLPGQAV